MGVLFSKKIPMENAPYKSALITKKHYNTKKMCILHFNSASSRTGTDGLRQYFMYRCHNI